MTYATQQNMIDRFGQQELVELTDEAGTGEIGAAKMAVALKDADTEINSYIAGRYPLPLTQTSDELERLACDIARYKLYDNRATELVKSRYDAAISKLKDISAGRASLGIDQASQQVEESGGVKYSAPERVFNADSLSGF